MSQIEQLTKDQESKLIEYRDKWLEVGLSISATNKKESEESVKKAYAVVGLKEPKIFIWLRSPLEGAIGAYFLTKLLKNFGAQVRDQVRAQVGDQVRDQVRAQVGDQVWDQVGDQVGAQVWDQVRDQVWAQVRDQVGAQVGAQVGDQVNQCGYGLHDASWLGFYEYFKNVVMLDCTKKLEPLMRLAEHCGWWWPFQNAVILTEKPIALRRDAQKRLHAEGQKSIEYSDGFGTYHFNGVKIPEKYGKLKPEEWKSGWILEEKNAELRRVLIQGIGYGKIAKDLKAKTLDSWKEYELLRIDNADVEPIVMIKMSCPSTGLLHAHRVPPDTKTAREAIKWCNWGIDKEEFLIER